jgi:flagellar hook protein FlgE
MGLLSSFNIGVSGLRASGDSMSVIGDNIANSGTTGFKKSRAEFQDLLSKSLKGIDGGDQVGSGTKLAHIKQQFIQGNINRTDNITDLAVNGNGFFMAETGFGTGFTRDGSFHFDKEGNLINGDGYKIKGFRADEEGKITNALAPIRLGNTIIPAEATSKVDMMMNLDSREQVKQFDALKPEETSSYQTSLTVYDNIGSPRLVNVYYNKVADNTWEFHALVDGKDAEGGVEGTQVEMGKGKVIFNAKGQLQDVTTDVSAFNFNKGAEPNQKIDFGFGEMLKNGGDPAKGSTQYGADSSISRHTADGLKAATLASLSFNDDGVLSAVYDNGETRDIAQIAIAKFENNEGLFKVGKNMFKESRKSGQGAAGKPGQDGRGSVLSKSLELSNVDIATEFIGLMQAQRNFQANTRTITTANEMLQEVLNIKR